MDWHPRELLGWQLSRTGGATIAGAALEQALIFRLGALGRVSTPFLLLSDNGLVFTSSHFRRLTKTYCNHPTLPAAERDGEAVDPFLKGTVHSPASLLISAARHANHRGLDPVL